MDPVPYLGGGVVSIPKSWQEAAADGWELVTVLVMTNGTRAGYFQRDGGVKITQAARDKIAEVNGFDQTTNGDPIAGWFKATFKNRIRLRTGEACKALSNFGLNGQPYTLRKLQEDGTLRPMHKVNGGKHDHWSRESLIKYIRETCKEPTP